MSYDFQFREIWQARGELLDGALFTLWLSTVAICLSLALAVVGAFARTSGPRWLQAAIASYVEIIRNTPFLIQIFLIYFGLPTITPLRLGANEGALLAMVMNGSAYAIEIVRAGIESVSSGQVQAGRALGLSEIQIFRFIVLPQALRVMVPPLGSQFVLLMLNSSIVSVVAADDLTAVGQNIAGRTFRSFEVFIVITVIYFLLSLVLTAAISGLAHATSLRGRRVG